MIAETAKIWGVENWVFAIGIVAQLAFSGRFLVQWLASEKAKQVTVPVAFWWLSIGGAALMIVYGILRQDVVIILGQCTGVFVYARNLYLRALSQKDQ